MRKILFAGFLAIIYFNSISQNLNRAAHEAVDGSGEMIAINSKVYYLYKTESSCCNRQSSLICKNEAGVTLFSTSLGSGEINGFGRLIKTNDKALFMNGSDLPACDVGPGHDYILKVDTNGTVVFKTVISSLASWGTPNITGITQHPDSSYYLVTSTDLFHYSSSGQFISRINSGLSAISSVLALNNGDLLLNGSYNNMNQNVIMTISGSVTTQAPCNNIVTKFVEAPNYFLGRTTSGTVEKYSRNLSQLNTTSATFGSILLNDLDVRNDTVFVAGTSGSSSFYAMLDAANLGALYQTTANFYGIWPTGIAVTRTNKVQVVGTGYTNNSKVSAFSFTSFYSMPLQGYFNSRSDVGIISFSNLNTRLIGSGSLGAAMTPELEMDVAVKNFGTDTVKRFYVNYYSFFNTGISWCYILLHKQCLTPVAPGDTISVATGTFYAQPFYANPSGSIMSDTKLDLCLFTSVPNETADADITNDAFCDSVYFSITGIKENVLSVSSLILYPNPFDDQFSITSNSQIHKLKLFNALGETVESREIGNKVFKYDSSNLSKGIYFLQIETEDGNVLKKIIKD